MVVVARAVGVAEYGWFTFGTALVSLLLSFGSLGIDVAVVRATAQDRERVSELFASGLVLRLTAGVVALGVAVLLAPLLLETSRAVATVALVGAALLVDELTTYVSTVFKAFERMRFHATTLVVNRLVSMALVLGAHLLGAGLEVLLAAYLVGSVGALVYAVAVLRRHFPPVHLGAARRATATTLLRTGAPLGVAAVLNMALFRADAVVVEAVAGSGEVGLYGVAFRCYEALVFVAWSLGTVTLPRFSAQGVGARTERLLTAAVTAALAVYVPALVGSLFLAREVVSTAFGERYAEAAQAVPWLMLALVLFGTTFVARSAAVGVGGRPSVAAVAGAALAVNVGLDLLLVPALGFEGAAIGTACAAAVEVVLTLVVLRRLGVALRPDRLLAVPLGAGAVMAGALGALSGAPALLAGVAGCAAYLAALALLGLLLAPVQARQVAGAVRRRAGAR